MADGAFDLNVLSGGNSAAEFAEGGWFDKFVAREFVAAGTVPFVDFKPSRPVPRPSTMHRYTHAVRPPVQPIVPPLTAFAPVRIARYPARDPGRHPRGRTVRPPAVISNPTVTPIGDPGVATFAMFVESGATVTMSWATDVMKAWAGKEQRRSLLRWPRLQFKFHAKLIDAQQRALMSELADSAAGAPIYLLGLAHEDISVVTAFGTNLTVSSLALCDWAQPGQRIVAVHPSNGTQADAIIQSAGGVSISTTTDISAVAVAGARLMPALQIHLDQRQMLGRHQVNAGEIGLVARAQRAFSVPTFGIGAAVNTYQSIAVWDVGIVSEYADQPLMSGTQFVDVGGRVSALGNFTEADWGRDVKFSSSSRVDWQWLKAFLEAVRGSSTVFLLPSGRPDLIPTTDASSGTLTVQGGAAGQPNYVSDWFPSLAHRRLKLVKTDGTFAYRTVASCADNGNGTQSLVLDSSLAGALSRVEFLEQVRLDSDDVSVEFRGPSFSTTLQARVVQR